MYLKIYEYFIMGKYIVVSILLNKLINVKNKKKYLYQKFQLSFGTFTRKISIFFLIYLMVIYKKSF